MEEILKILIKQQKLQREEMQLVREQMQQMMQNNTNQQSVAVISAGCEDLIARRGRVKDLADSMVSFDYDPDNNATFDSWYKRYVIIFTVGANGLEFR